MTTVTRPRVLVTRSAQQASALAEYLRELGAEPVLIPTIEIVPPVSFERLDVTIEQLRSFDWLVFTSVNAVEAFADRLTHYGLAFEAGRLQRGRELAGSSVATSSAERQDSSGLPRLAAIGEATAQAMVKLGFAAASSDVLLPEQPVSESFADALVAQLRQPGAVTATPKRFLLVRAEEAREVLPEVLHAAGAEVVIAPAYRTRIPESSVDAVRDLFSSDRSAAAITFTSSSSVRNLLALCAAAGVALPRAALRVSIGPITSGTLRELGLPPHAEAPEALIRSLAETVVKALQSRGTVINQKA